MPSGNTTTTQVATQPIQDPGALGDVVGTLGQGVSQASEMLERSRSLYERTKAQNVLQARLTDIHTRAEQEQDLSPERTRLYQEEIGKAVSESSAMVSIPEEQGLFSLDARGRADIEGIKINSIFNQKLLALGKAEDEVYLQNKGNDFIKAIGAGEKEMAVNERNLKLKEMVGAGRISAAEAVELKAKYDKAWAKSQVEYDIDTNPDMARELLEAKAYPNLDEAERVELLNDAKSAALTMKKNAEASEKLVQKDVQEEIIGKMIDGTLNIQNLSAYRGNVSEQFYKNARDALLSGKTVNPEVKAETYNRLQDQFVFLNITNEKKGITTASLDQLAKFRVDVIEAYVKGEISVGERNSFLNKVSVAFDEKAIKETRKSLHWWQALGDWVERNADDIEEVKMDMTKKYYSRVDDGEDPEAVSKDLILQEQSRMNPSRLQYEVGQKITRGGANWEVIGYSESGEPLFKRAK